MSRALLDRPQQTAGEPGKHWDRDSWVLLEQAGELSPTDGQATDVRRRLDPGAALGVIGEQAQLAE